MIGEMFVWTRVYFSSGADNGASGTDPGFLTGEGAKGMMTLYGMGMSDF